MYNRIKNVTEFSSQIYNNTIIIIKLGIKVIN